MLLETKEIREEGIYMVDNCQLSRAYSDEVCVMLPCGYRQRFFTIEKEDAEYSAKHKWRNL